MKGTHHVEVKNRDAVFKFDLQRNITIVRGDSGTGKTTLFDMIADYTRLHDASGVNISCDKPCAALIDLDWKHQLEGICTSLHSNDSRIRVGYRSFKSLMADLNHLKTPIYSRPRIFKIEEYA